MAENSGIEWTDHTWSPWEGCQKVSPGCDHCYAESMNRWLRKGENWGPGAPRRTYSDEHWEKPLRWDAAACKAGTAPKVFPSVCDPFDKAAPDGERERFWRLIEATPHLTWLLLTKRIGNVKDMLPWRWAGALPPNVWLGATIVNQEEADRDIPKLLATPARVRFLSMEPLLGPVDFSQAHAKMAKMPWVVLNHLQRTGKLPTVDWVIAGGESGRGARPAHPDWFRSLRAQCASAGVPFLFKQWGEWLPVDNDGGELYPDGHGGDDIQGRFKAVMLDGQDLARVGKKAAGRLLDGVTHNGFPEVRQ